MIIGIDGNEANVGNRVGVNVWAYELLKELHKNRTFADAEDKLSFQIYLSAPPVADMPQERKGWQYRVIGPGKFWTRWRLPLDLYLHRSRPQVFLSLSHYSPKWAPMPRVVSIMDLSFLKFPEAFQKIVAMQLTRWTRESILKSKKIITISKFNKEEIAKVYGIDESRIGVVYPGVGEIFTNFIDQSLRVREEKKREVRNKYQIGSKYLVFVGTRQPKKNLSRLLKAFEIVNKRYLELELVVAGKTWRQFKKVTSDKLQVSRRGVKYLGFVEDRELPALIAGAEALVLPSLYEGFGIPAAEAMAVGTPAAVSDATSLPEVVGNVGITFDPDSVEEIANGIIKVCELPSNERKKMIKQGMIRVKMFEWDKTAKRVLDILKLVVRNNENG